MRFLADMGVARSTVRALRGRGHDVLHLQEAGLRQLPDDAILDKARQDNRVILSFDLNIKLTMDVYGKLAGEMALTQEHDDRLDGLAPKAPPAPA